jgi:hypothetical protein
MTTIQPFLLEPIQERVQRELYNRQRAVSADKKTTSELAWNNMKTPWVMIQSNAIKVKENGELDDNESKLARKWVLLGGTLYNGKLRSSLDTNYELGEHQQQKPMPGVDKLNVEMKGTLGTIREAKFSFTCYTTEQFSIMQSLYMTPGIGLLLEWGWSTVKSTTSSTNLFTIIPTSEDRFLVKHLRKNIDKSQGNYDAMIGYITDFSADGTDDGGWACNITVVGPSGILTGIPLSQFANKLGDSFISDIDNKMNQYIDKNKNSKHNEVWVFHAIKPDISFETKLTPQQELQKEKVKESSGGDITLGNLFDALTSGPGGSAVVASKLATTKAVSDVVGISRDSNIYVTWKFIEDSINSYFGNKNGLPSIVIDSNYTEPLKKDTYIIPVYYPNFPLTGKYKITGRIQELWRSFYPKDIIIPAIPKGGFVKEVNSGDVFGEKEQANGKQFYVQEQGEYASSFVGDLSVVFLNYNLLVRDAFENSDTLEEAINKLLTRLNNASGGFWDLKLLYNGNDSTTMRVVDYNCPYGWIKQTKVSTTQTNVYSFFPYRKDSIVREHSLTFSVPNSLKTTIYIATNAKEIEESSPAETERVSALRNFSQGWTDRFSFELTSLEKKKNTDEEVKEAASYNKIQWEKQRGVIDATKKDADLLKSLLKKPYFEDLTSEEMEVCTRFLNRFKSVESEFSKDFTHTILIPLEASITIDGISGITWGNSFNISGLPPKYKDRTIFQIFNVSHEITGDSWTTTIGGKMRMLPKVVRGSDLLSTEAVLDGQLSLGGQKQSINEPIEESMSEDSYLIP